MKAKNMKNTKGRNKEEGNKKKKLKTNAKNMKIRRNDGDEEKREEEKE